MSCLDAPSHFFNPLLRNSLDLLFPVYHEGEGPSEVTFAFGAVAGGLATSGPAGRQRTWQKVFGDMEAPNEFELPLSKQ